MSLLSFSLPLITSFLSLGNQLVRSAVSSLAGLMPMLGTSEQLCNTTGSCETLFSYATGAVAFLFIIVVILIFVFIYDNMRRGRKVPAT